MASSSTVSVSSPVMDGGGGNDDAGGGESNMVSSSVSMGGAAASVDVSPPLHSSSTRCDADWNTTASTTIPDSTSTTGAAAASLVVGAKGTVDASSIILPLRIERQYLNILFLLPSRSLIIIRSR